MGRIIDRRRVMGGGNAQIPYIMDGCIGFWDGEWNEDFKVHNPNATIWKDLSSAAKDLSMRQGDGYFTWESNRLRCLGKGYIASLATTYSDFQTIEFVFSIDDITNDGAEKMQMLVWGATTKGVMATAYNSTKVYVQCGTRGVPGRMEVANSAHDFDGKIFQVAAVFTQTNSNTVSRNYCNGVQLSVLEATNLAGGNFFTIGGQSNGNRIAKGYIYTVRLYNRALSDEEIIHNWNIDNSRFNIL